MAKDYRVSNVYYMLAYALNNGRLPAINNEKLNSENFENVFDLYAFLLSQSVGYLIKKGLFKNYICEEDSLYTIRGRININKTIKENTLLKHKLVCNYDEYSENILMNKIIKTTMYYLIKSNKVSKYFIKNLKNVYAYLNEVDLIYDINSIQWKTLKFTRNNNYYESVIMICKMTLDSVLLTEKSGINKVLGLAIKKEDYHSLFEAFIRNYYRSEYSGKLTSEVEKIKWSILTDDPDNSGAEKIPNMNTDISLIHGKTELIIDAKFYTKTLSDKSMNGYDKKSIHSNNWYQINSYVINKKYQKPDMNISGMLLYAKTNEDELPEVKVNIMGNYLYVKTLDMTRSFDEIKKQLLEIGKLVNINI